MGFWDVAGKVAKGAANMAVEIAKELPSELSKQVGKQAERRLESDDNLSSEQKEKLERIAERSKNRS